MEALQAQTRIVSPTYPKPAPRPTTPDPDRPAIRVVHVDGHAVRVRSGGMEHRGRAPAVVLETGAGERLETWDPILADVAAFASVVAYDRPGLGESAPDGEPPTPVHPLVARLSPGVVDTRSTGGGS